MRQAQASVAVVSVEPAVASVVGALPGAVGATSGSAAPRLAAGSVRPGVARAHRTTRAHLVASPLSEPGAAGLVHQLGDPLGEGGRAGVGLLLG